MHKIDPYNEIANRGKFIHIYSATNIGKTTSALATLPEPILCILGEARSLLPSIEAIGRKINIYKTPVFFEDPSELRKFLADLLLSPKDLGGFNSVLADGLSNFYNNSVGAMLEDEFYTTLEKKGKVTRPLGQQTDRDMSVYGSMSSELLRIFNLLSKFSAHHNKVVVSVSLIRTIDRRIRKDIMGQREPVYMTNPQFSELAGRLDIPDSVDNYDVPNFDGKVFLKEFPGLVDMIGKVESRRNDEGNLIFPPLVRFEGDDFMSKFTGKRERTSGPLDITKILGLEGGK